MIILGLTGSIGMGKSFVATLFRKENIPVFDADKAVHRLLAENGAAVKKVAALFPAAYKEGAIDRKVLGACAFGNKQGLKALEHILHPLVRKAQGQFIKKARLQKKPMVIVEIPLLFETNGEKRCDRVITVTAPAFLQQKRVMRRPLMTKAKLASIRALQMSDYQKRQKTDYLVYTGLGKAATYRQIKNIIKREIASCVR